MREMKEMTRVKDLLEIWVRKVERDNRENDTTINLYSENLALRLLNIVYGYNLENLNWSRCNYKAVDLADHHEGIAFQVTSEDSLRKIKKTLGKFYAPDGPHKKFPRGIYFFFLKEIPPTLRAETKKKLHEIAPGFDPTSHMLGMLQLKKEIERLYSMDRSRYQQIKTILEEEFGHEEKIIGRREVLKELYRGSRRYLALLKEKGRFRYLKEISNILLSPARQDQQELWFDTPTAVDGQGADPAGTQGTVSSLLVAVPELWKEKCRHVLLKGEGGMGKTVSIIRLWEKYTGSEEYNPQFPVPVFVPLSEYSQRISANEPAGFIQWVIKQYYLDERTRQKELLDVFREPFGTEEDGVPSVLLMLDGLNEITAERSELRAELRSIIENWQGVQVLISSRPDLRYTMGLTDFHLLELLELHNEVIEQYLSSRVGGAMTKIESRGDNRLRKLLRNPMMLTIYAASCEVVNQYRMNPNFDFKQKDESAGEILWNFIEAQVVKYFENRSLGEQQFHFYKLLLKMLLPALGYEMEKAGRFQLSEDELDELVEKYLRRFSSSDFLSTFREYRKFVSAWCIDDYKSNLNISTIVETVLGIFSDQMFMLVKDGQSYRFIHQNFRDFFASVYILNEMSIGLKRGEVTELLRGRAISYYPRHYLGELEGLHHRERQPFLVEGQGWKLNENKDSLLYKSLDKCRGFFDDSVGLAVWNIVETWKDFRGDLSGMDLSNLDLSKAFLHGVNCGRFFKNKYMGTLFDGSLITEETFLPERHIGNIKSLALSNDGERFLACSLKLVAEHDIETGRCLVKFSGHSNTVNSVSYSPDEQKVLTASADSTIKEWDRVSGKCLMTFEGHSQEVHKAIYSNDGKKILSASKDKTIREWDSETGECGKIFTGHSFEVIGAVYAENGKMILSRSSDKTFRVWDSVKGKCLYTSPVFPERMAEVRFNEEVDQIVGAVRMDNKNLFKINWVTKTFGLFDISKFFCIDFHLKSRKVAAGYYGGYIKEWDLETGNCLKTLRGQSSTIGSIKYSEDGSRIISGNDSGTIEYWDAGNGHLLKTYIGRMIMIKSAVFSNDGRRLLIASADGLVKEWDLDQGKFSKFFSGHLGSVCSAVYSLDGKRVLSTSTDNTIKEWDLETGECLKTFRGHSNSVNSALYSSDGTRVLSASSDKTIREWDWETGKCINVFKGHSLAVNSAVYSSNGMKILSTSCDNGHPIHEWCRKTGDCLKIYKGHKHIVQKARYIDDDKKILSMALDRTLKEWRVEDGKCLNSTEINWLYYCYPFDEEIPAGIKINPISAYQVEVLETSSNKRHWIENVPQLNVLGCSFKNLHPKSQLTRKLKNLLENHGGTF
jgi:WD40 repeat protein